MLAPVPLSLSITCVPLHRTAQGLAGCRRPLLYAFGSASSACRDVPPWMPPTTRTTTAHEPGTARTTPSVHTEKRQDRNREVTCELKQA